jgi:hypothetical protein
MLPRRLPYFLKRLERQILDPGTCRTLPYALSSQQQEFLSNVSCCHLAVLVEAVALGFHDLPFRI